MKKFFALMLACLMLMSVACTMSSKKIAEFKEIAEQAQAIEKTEEALENVNELIDEKSDNKTEEVKEADKQEKPVVDPVTEHVDEQQEEQSGSQMDIIEEIVTEITEAAENDESKDAEDDAQNKETIVGNVVIETIEEDITDEDSGNEGEETETPADKEEDLKIGGNVLPDPADIYGDDIGSNLVDFNADIIRDASNTFSSSSVRVIKSVSQLQSALNGTTLKDKVSKYDDAFFASHVLFYIHVGANSGSVQFSVVSVERDGKTLKINGVTKTPEIGTCDMAGWGIFVSISSIDYNGTESVTSNLLNRGFSSIPTSDM